MQVMQVILEAKNISKRFGGVQALKNFSFAVLQEEIHGLVGENGAGKSTLVKILTGVIKPDSGSIIFNGQTYSYLTPLQALKMGIQVVHQDFSLFPNLTVAENIFSPNYSLRFSPFVKWKKVMNDAHNILSKLGIDHISPNAYVESLSVGDRQLVAIARAVALEARVLILDEPTSALTYKEITRLFEFLKQLKNRGMSIIIITHKLDEIFKLANRVTVIRDGEGVGTFNIADLTRADLEYLMTGHKVAELETQPGRGKGTEIIMQIEGLSKKGQFENVTFNIRKGEIVGLIGPLGSGRTELALALIGVTAFDRGNIFLEGKKVRFKSPAEALNAGVVYCPEDRLSAGLFLDYSLLSNVVSTNFHAVRNPVWRLLSKYKMVTLTKKAVEDFQIKTGSIFSPVKTLSGGNQQKVVLSKYLLRSPKILIVDKPTFGIDIKTKTYIHSLLRSLAQQGVSVLLISDEAPEVLRCADRILVMRSGKIIAELEADKTDEGTLNELVYGERQYLEQA
jgi:ABC-type sugar transport system ATPase subunit